MQLDAYLVIAFIVGVVMPAMAIFSAGHAQALLEGHPEKMPAFYRQTSLTHIIIAGTILLVFYLKDQSSNIIGIEFMNDPLWVGSLFLGGWFAWWISHQVPMTPKRRQRIEKRYGELSFLLPADSISYRWSLVVSFTAGICEEIIYRGFLFWYIAQFVPVVAALVIVNIIFGLSHYSSKRKNALYAAALGVAWSVMYIYTESLWLAMLTHLAIDIHSFTMSYRLLSRREETV